LNEEECVALKLTTAAEVAHRLKPQNIVTDQNAKKVTDLANGLTDEKKICHLLQSGFFIFL